jgi:hypothetical protein
VWANDGFSLERELSRTEFRRVLRRETILDYVHRDEPWDAEFVRRTLAEVARLPSLEAPMFAFVHVLNPHWPYVFDRDCRTPRRLSGRNPRAEYLGQLHCLNGLVLATVGHLIRDSKVPPVIILQGDHGSAMRGHWVKTSRSAKVESVPASVAWERLGAFGVPCGRVRTVPEALQDPQIEARQMLLDFGDPDMKGVRVLGNPIKLSRDGARPTRRAPLLGEHTEEILTQVCGFSTDKIEQMKADGAFSVPERRKK